MSAPGIAPQTPPPTIPASEHEREQDGPGQIAEAERGDRREQGAEEDLTLAADVDHPGPEGDADPGADEQQRRRLDRRVGQLGATAEGALEKSALNPSHGDAPSSQIISAPTANAPSAAISGTATPPSRARQMTVGCPGH